MEPWIYGVATKATYSPNWTERPGWSRCTSRSWARQRVRPLGSSPRACPRWCCCSTPLRSHFAPWLAGAPPGRLYAKKLGPLSIADFAVNVSTHKKITQKHLESLLTIGRTDWFLLTLPNICHNLDNICVINIGREPRPKTRLKLRSKTCKIALTIFPSRQREKKKNIIVQHKPYNTTSC